MDGALELGEVVEAAGSGSSRGMWRAVGASDAIWCWPREPASNALRLGRRDTGDAVLYDNPFLATAIDQNARGDTQLPGQFLDVDTLSGHPSASRHLEGTPAVAGVCPLPGEPIAHDENARGTATAPRASGISRTGLPPANPLRGGTRAP